MMTPNELPTSAKLPTSNSPSSAPSDSAAAVCPDEPVTASGASAPAPRAVAAPPETSKASALGGLSGAPSASGAASVLGAPGAQSAQGAPRAKLRKRLPGAKGAPAAAGLAASEPPADEGVKVLVVVNDDGFIEVFVKGQNFKSKLVERSPGMSDEQFDRAIGYAWQDVNFPTHRRHTSMVKPPLKRIEDLVREVWELKRRYRVLSLSNVASLAAISQMCGARMLDVMDWLTDQVKMREYQSECDRTEAGASLEPAG